MAAAGIVLPQLLWVVDFVGELFGVPIVGMTTYMFEPQNPLFNRSLSLFHGWLPFLLLWLVWRVGYDRRGLWAWVATSWVLIVVCYLWMPPPPEPGAVVDPNLPVNINYVSSTRLWLKRTKGSPSARVQICHKNTGPVPSSPAWMPGWHHPVRNSDTKGKKL